MATGRIGTTPVLTTRWSKAPSAGTTSLSGLDDNSVSLVYSVGYEAVYQNGVLLSRGNDYTATNGTSITLTTATVAGDIIEVFANQTIPLTDTYSQTVSDGRFIKNTLTTTTGDIIYASAANTPARLGIGSTGQVLKVSGGVPSWGADTAGSLTKLASASFSGAATVDIDNVFSSTYDVYLFTAYATSSTSGADFLMQLRYAGPTTMATSYYTSAVKWNRSGTESSFGQSDSTSSMLDDNLSNNTAYPSYYSLYFNNLNATGSFASWWGTGVLDGTQSTIFGGGNLNTTSRAYTGLRLSASAGNITGKYYVYGVEK